MSDSTDLETQAGTDIEQISDEERALIEQNQSEAVPGEYRTPILKLAQPLTKEVTDGDGSVRPGHFVVELTGESFGDKIEFIVSGTSKGRFKPGRDGERSRGSDSPTVDWTDDPFYGQPWSEHPDAQEQYSKRVNEKQHAWESGPPIQTSYNYTGYIAGSPVPVRLGLRKTQVPVAFKWNTILDAVLRGRYWDQVFEVSSYKTENDKGTFYNLVVKPGRKTTPEERQQAVSLAQALRRRAVTTVGEEEETAPAPKDTSAEDAAEF